MNVLTFLGSIDVESAEWAFSFAPLYSVVRFIVSAVI